MFYCFVCDPTVGVRRSASCCGCRVLWMLFMRGTEEYKEETDSEEIYEDGACFLNLKFDSWIVELDDTYFIAKLTLNSELRVQSVMLECFRKHILSPRFLSVPVLIRSKIVYKRPLGDEMGSKWNHFRKRSDGRSKWDRIRKVTCKHKTYPF